MRSNDKIKINKINYTKNMSFFAIILPRLFTWILLTYIN